MLPDPASFQQGIAHSLELGPGIRSTSTSLPLGCQVLGKPGHTPASAGAESSVFCLPGFLYLDLVPLI